MSIYPDNICCHIYYIFRNFNRIFIILQKIRQTTQNNPLNHHGFHQHIWIFLPSSFNCAWLSNYRLLHYDVRQQKPHSKYHHVCPLARLFCHIFMALHSHFRNFNWIQRRFVTLYPLFTTSSNFDLYNRHNRRQYVFHPLRNRPKKCRLFHLHGGLYLFVR